MKVTQRKWFSVCTLLIAVFYTLLPTSTQAQKETNHLVNIINFIRNTEPRIDHITDEVLFNTVVSQTKCLQKHGLIGTYLLQYDALINQSYQTLMREEMARGCEVGGWWEITEPHVKAAGLEWRGRYPWDWHTNVGFSVGYTPEEREKLVDVYMEKFKSLFGNYPRSVGSWFIDAHSLAYMYNKYHIVASCNCRDQVGTDGYTLWGGYWGQAFYPSRKNAYMPAQTEKGQIGVPIFRMLGSDPIYQYDAGVGGAVQSVATLEPVYGGGGGSPKWVDWFFNTFTNDPVVGFNYVQAGQENSFTWGPMKTGFEYQMELIDKLAKEGKLTVKTLEESGLWFKKQFKTTPITANSVMNDQTGNNKKTVWFNSRFYRTNLLWEENHLKIRDIHLFKEEIESDYLRKPTTSTQCFYLTLPFVDGCLWSQNHTLAGMHLMKRNVKGEWQKMEGGKPTITNKGKNLFISWPLLQSEGALNFLLKENCMDVKLNGKSQEWCLQLEVAPEAKIPFTEISDKQIKATERGFNYSSKLKTGRFEDLRQQGEGKVLRIMPQNGRIVWAF